MVNKPYFSCNAAAVTGHRTIFADNSMARDDNRDAVSAVAAATARVAVGLPISIAID